MSEKTHIQAVRRIELIVIPDSDKECVLRGTVGHAVDTTLSRVLSAFTVSQRFPTVVRRGTTLELSDEKLGSSDVFSS